METYRSLIPSRSAFRRPPVSMPAPLVLARGMVRTVAASSGSVLRCLQGECWLTRAGDPRDHLLREGDSLVLIGRQEWVVQALTTCRLEIDESR